MPDLVFSVDSALLSELGEKLVESVHVALLELVKNAYDADATQVTVKILLTKSGAPEVHVIDNGSGMTFGDVQRYWMRIATTHKVKRDVSPLYGRPLVGSKGIGRFSCRRLGRRLKLTTTAKVSRNRFQMTEVAFDWMAFKPGKDVTEVTCPGVRKSLQQATTGTILRISDASEDEWSKRGYNYLKRQLAVLVANRGVRRKRFTEDPGFEVVLEALGFEGDTTDLRQKLLSAGWGTLKASVDRKGCAHCTLTAKKIGKKRITSAPQFKCLAGTKLEVGILMEGRENMRDTSALSQGTLRPILSDWGGICVRHRGVRVYPYGEPGNDWLDIDRDRGLRKGSLEEEDLISLAHRLKDVDPTRVLLSMLSARNYVGEVDIGLRATGFVIKVNREGFLQSAALEELKRFIRYAVDWGTIYRDYYVRLKAREESVEARRDFEAAIERPVEAKNLVPTAVRYIQKQACTLAAQLPTKERQKVQGAVTAAAQAVLREDDLRREEVSHLRLIASTSTLLLIFSHEVKSLIGDLDTAVAWLRNIQKGLPAKTANACRQFSEDLTSTKERFIGLLKMTSLIGIEGKRASPFRLALKDRLERAKRCFKLITSAYDIDVQISKVPTSLKVGPMLEAEIYALALNVLSNSIKSVIAAGGKKLVEFEAYRSGNRTLLHIRDTGIGIRESEFEEVFVPFIADPRGQLYAALEKRLNPEDQYIVGTGSGLGLSILREIVRSRGGDVRFVKPSGKWRADLEVELR